PEGRVVILDFGIASEFSPDRLRGETVEEGIWGSVPYMSPEQLEGGAVDAASDVWAAGVMAYEWITGKRPFARERSAEEAAAALVRSSPGVRA
ncbi:MAG: protein kinase domain-containing protein, partial [Vicinamibacterales bacterium]